MILTTPPRKLYKGKKRLCLSHIRHKLKILTWALSVKVGDYIATCEGCNRKVAKIEYVWLNEGWHYRIRRNKSWYLDEVIFTDTNGGLHYCPGGGCASPASTNKEIIHYWQEAWQQNIELDEFGECHQLPKFDW